MEMHKNMSPDLNRSKTIPTTVNECILKFTRLFEWIHNRTEYRAVKSHNKSS